MYVLRHLRGQNKRENVKENERIDQTIAPSQGQSQKPRKKREMACDHMSSGPRTDGESKGVRNARDGWRLPLLGPCGSIGSSHDAREIENSLGIPHVLGCFDLQVSGFFGERGFDIGHNCF